MHQKTSKIVVTGMGVMCSLGQSVNQFWQAIKAKNSGIQFWEDLEALDFKYSHAGRIANFDCDPLNRGFYLSKHAIAEALDMSQFSTSLKAGLFLGTTMGESGAFEAIAEGDKNIDPKDYTGDAICRNLRISFPQLQIHRCYATACAAGNYAIIGAMNALKNKRIDAAIAGGVDPFSKIALTGFTRSRAMSPSGFCKPFSPQRDGMILGEGSGFLVLERLEDAKKRKATILAMVDGGALSCDAFHPTAPKPDSSGIIRCFNQLLKQTDTSIKTIDWICAHGTGTKLSDASEAQAIKKVFKNNAPIISSVKAHIGHTLGAATAIEAIVSVLSIKDQCIPPTANTLSTDFDIDVATQVIEKPINNVLNCGYAFGGLNSITQFSKWN